MVYPEFVRQYLAKWAAEDATFDQLQAAFPADARMITRRQYKNLTVFIANQAS